MIANGHVIQTGDEALRTASLILANQGNNRIGLPGGKTLRPKQWDSEGRLVLGGDGQNLYLLAKDGLQRISIFHYDSTQNQTIDLASKSAQRSQWLETMGKAEIAFCIAILTGPAALGMGWAAASVGLTEKFANAIDIYVKNRDKFQILQHSLGAAYAANKQLKALAPGLAGRIMDGMWDRSETMGTEKSGPLEFKDVVEGSFEALKFLIELKTPKPKEVVMRKVKLLKAILTYVFKGHAKNFGRLTAESLLRIGVKGECVQDVLAMGSEPALYDPKVQALLQKISKDLTDAIVALKVIIGDKTSDDRDLRSEFTGGIVPVVAGQKMNVLATSGARR